MVHLALGLFMVVLGANKEHLGVIECHVDLGLGLARELLDGSCRLERML